MKATYTIRIRQAEGVWTATGIPGLNIEASSRESAEAEARAWAGELLVDNGIIPPEAEFGLAFEG